MGGGGGGGGLGGGLILPLDCIVTFTFIAKFQRRGLYQILLLVKISVCFLECSSL